MATDLAALAVSVDLTELKALTDKLDDVINKSDKTDKKISSLEKQLSSLSKTADAAGSVAFAALSAGVAASVLTFADLETRLVAVQKTTDFTASEMEQFKGIISDMASEIPVSTATLYDIAGAAGQLGIKGVENISAFTETMGKLSLATDIVGDEGTQSVARLLNVLGEAPTQVSTFGNVLVALGNNSAATESQILSLATEVGLATSTFAVTSADAAAMGATLASLGVRAELGGSAVGRTMRAMEDAINEGGVAAQNLSAITGVTASDLKAAFGEDSTKLFEKFVIGLGDVIDSGVPASEALEKFGLSGEEILKVLPTLATNSDTLSKSLEIANSQLENGTALQDEVAKASVTLASQWQYLKNIATEYADSIGSQLAPEIKGVITAIREWYQVNGEVAKFEIKIAIEAVSGAVSYLWATISQADDVVTAAFGSIAIETEKLNKNFSILTTAPKYSFEIAFDEVMLMASDLGNNVADSLSKIPLIGEEIAKGLRETSAGYAEGTDSAARFAEEIAVIEQNYNNNVAAITATTESTFELASAEAVVAEAATKSAKSSISAKQGVVETAEAAAARQITLADDTGKADEAASKKSLAAAEKAAEARAELEQDLAEKLMELTESELTVKLAALDREVEGMMELEGISNKTIDNIWEYYEAKTKAIIKAEEEKNEEVEELSKDLTDKINELKMEELDYNLWALEEELKEAQKFAEKDAALRDKITEYRKLKTAEIKEDYKDTEWEIYGIAVDHAQLTEDLNQSVVDAFVAGEDAKVAAASVASDYLADYSVAAATKALEPVVEAIGEQVASWVTLGEAQTVTEGDTWTEKISNGAGYLAAATAAVLGAMAISDQFATGGWIGRNPGGGVITGGSGIRDDVLLGYTRSAAGTVANIGMGGEFVINKETTQQNLPFLTWLNQTRCGQGCARDGKLPRETFPPLSGTGDARHGEGMVRHLASRRS